MARRRHGQGESRSCYDQESLTDCLGPSVNSRKSLRSCCLKVNSSSTLEPLRLSMTQESLLIVLSGARRSVRKFSKSCVCGYSGPSLNTLDTLLDAHIRLDSVYYRLKLRLGTFDKFGLALQNPCTSSSCSVLRRQSPRVDHMPVRKIFEICS